MELQKVLNWITFLVRMHVCVFMALITALVLFARSQDLVMSVSVRRVNVVFSTAGFKGGGKPCRKTRETTRYGEASRRPRTPSRVRTQAH